MTCLYRSLNLNSSDNSINTKTENNEVLKASTDRGNRTIITSVRTDIVTDYYDDGSIKIKKIVNTMTNIVGNYNEGEEGYPEPVKTTMSFAMVHESKVDIDGKVTNLPTEESSMVIFGGNPVLDAWTDYIHNYNQTNESDVPFVKDVTEKVQDKTIKAFQIGMLPFIAAGIPTSLAISPKATKVISAVGGGTSAGYAYEKLGIIMTDYVTSDGIVLTVSSSVNSEVNKLPKTPNSKDEKNIGPSSIQDLFDPGKWKEWWYGDEDADKK